MIGRILLGTIVGSVVAFVVTIAIAFGLSIYFPNGPTSRSMEIQWILLVSFSGLLVGSNVAVRFIGNRRVSFGLVIGILSGAFICWYMLPRVQVSTQIFVVGISALLGSLGGWFAGKPKQAL